MSKTVVIHLEFENDDVDDADVYNYLNELMENKCLGYEVESNE